MNWYKLKIRRSYSPENADEMYMQAHSAEDALVCAEKGEYSLGHVIGISCIDQPPEDNISYQMWKYKQKQEQKNG